MDSIECPMLELQRQHTLKMFTGPAKARCLDFGRSKDQTLHG